MRTITTLFAALLCFTKAGAQFKIDDNALYKVTYITKHFYDTTDFTKVRIDNMNLYAGKKYSLFRDAGYEEYLVLQEKRKQEVEADIAAGKMIRLPSLKPVAQSEMFIKIDAGDMLLKEKLAANIYVITDTLPSIKWNIYDESKKIGGLNCQKAIGRYKGRSYTTWFCPDLPVSTGPWALRGLPGTILEAIDSRNHVQFLFAGYEEVASPGTAMALPEKYITATRKEWDRLYAAFQNDPIQFLNSNQSNPNVKVTLTMPAGASPLKRPVINNPIILPEK